MFSRVIDSTGNKWMFHIAYRAMVTHRVCVLVFYAEQRCCCVVSASSAVGAETSGYGAGESEDMLQMALRMASMPASSSAMDLESQLQATPVNPSESSIMLSLIM